MHLEGGRRNMSYGPRNLFCSFSFLYFFVRCYRIRFAVLSACRLSPAPNLLAATLLCDGGRCDGGGCDGGGCDGGGCGRDGCDGDGS